MHLNSTHLVRGAAKALLRKRGIHEAELLSPAVQAVAPLLVRTAPLLSDSGQPVDDASGRPVSSMMGLCATKVFPSFAVL